MSDDKRPLTGHMRPTPAQAAAVQRWAMPEVGGPIIGRAPREEKRSGPDTVEVLRQALQEAEARGYQEGQAKAQAESLVAINALKQQVLQLDSVLKLLAQPLAHPRKPRRAISIVERHAGRHLGARGGIMQIIGIDERPPQRRGERAADRRLAASRRTHHDDDHW